MLEETQRAIKQAEEVAFESTYSTAFDIECLNDFALVCDCRGAFLIGQFLEKQNGPTEKEDLKLALELLTRAEELRGTVKDIENQI
jgi:hypothetical protein